MVIGDPDRVVLEIDSCRFRWGRTTLTVEYRPREKPVESLPIFEWIAQHTGYYSWLHNQYLLFGERLHCSDLIHSGKYRAVSHRRGRYRGYPPGSSILGGRRARYADIYIFDHFIDGKDISSISSRDAAYSQEGEVGFAQQIAISDPPLSSNTGFYPNIFPNLGIRGAHSWSHFVISDGSLFNVIISMPQTIEWNPAIISKCEGWDIVWHGTIHRLVLSMHASGPALYSVRTFCLTETQDVSCVVNGAKYGSASADTRAAARDEAAHQVLAGLSDPA